MYVVAQWHDVLFGILIKRDFAVALQILEFATRAKKLIAVRGKSDCRAANK